LARWRGRCCIDGDRPGDGPASDEEFRDRSWQPDAPPTGNHDPRLVEISERDAVTFVMCRLTQPDAAPLSRYRYWAYFAGGDPSRSRRITYDLPGHGYGLYTRYAGDHPTGLIRFDRHERSGARLDADGHWWWTESPERNVWLGSDHGEPVSTQQAEQVAVALGHPASAIHTDTLDGRP
jgi:hypothetical protein